MPDYFSAGSGIEKQGYLLKKIGGKPLSAAWRRVYATLKNSLFSYCFLGKARVCFYPSLRARAK